MAISISHTARGLAALGILFGLGLAACAAPIDSGDETSDSLSDALSDAQKKPVCDHIKAVSAARGVTNPVVFAGVPNHESGLVQCWKDATWACQGPHSNYCGGPVIAGSGDGPCSQQQGGLGMYQLDAGTYAQTLASYGPDLVELDAQIDKGVSVIINKVWHCPNTPGFKSEADVVAWINSARPGTANYETFLSAMAYCYNGTPPGSSHFQAMRSNYRGGVQRLVDAFGAGYWSSAAVAQPASEDFDAAFYLDIYPDLEKAFGNDTAAAGQHWMTNGKKEGRMASPAFDSRFYLASYGDLKSAFGASNWVAAVAHWESNGVSEGRKGSPVFDPKFYLAHHGDLKNAFGATGYAAAVDHYIANGIHEGRQASAEFDPQYYLGHNADVAAAYGAKNYLGAVEHYLKYGRGEGRKGAQ